MIRLDVNADNLIKFTNQLESVSRTAFPKAVRATLNSLAFDVKKNTMPKTTEKAFVNRDKNFFRANSRVEMAKGNHVDGMSSMVGFLAAGNVKSKDAVDNLEEQERGGVIRNRSFVPKRTSRTSKNYSRMVARRNRLRNIKRIVVVSEAPGKTHGQKFIQSAIHAGEKGILLTQNSLLRIDKMERKNGKWVFKITRLYSYKENRSVRIKRARFFMRDAVEQTSKKMPDIYYDEISFQMEKHFRKAGKLT